MKMTQYRLDVLRGVKRKVRATVWSLGHIAPDHVRSPGEWAGPHLRWLKENGLVSVAGKDRLGAKIYTITDAGRKALEENA